jgi:hypothetical protein
MFVPAASYYGSIGFDKEVAPLVSWSLLLEHFGALALLWACVLLPGFALLPWLRVRLGLAGVPLLGIVYWTVALFLLPFNGGMDIAAGLAFVFAALAGVLWWRRGAPRPVWTRASWSMLVFGVGQLPFLTTLFSQYVPFGMDASMHATGAVLIGCGGGLPARYAPMTPGLAFPSVNLGLPAIAGVGIRWGGDPAAIMLAAHHLTFTGLILATYILMRTWVGRTPAMVLAVSSVWLARASETTLEWGGFPTVLSVAVGLFAARLLLQQGRTPSWPLALATGAAIAATPLVHGCGGGTWLYCVGPWALVAAWAQTPNKTALSRSLALTFAMAGLLLMVYRSVGILEVNAQEMQSTRECQESSAPKGENVWLASTHFIFKDSGNVIVSLGWTALAFLLLRRQWLAFGVLTGAWAAMLLVVVNARYWVLPASFLLYPERTLYWAAPLSAVGLALAWRRVPMKLPKLVGPIVALSLLGVAAYFHNIYYQRIARQDYVNADGWAALLWARENLQPGHDFVQAPYNSTGSFLPPFARIACSGAHHHHFVAQQLSDVNRQRNVTHVLIDQALSPQTETPVGTIVFHCGTITIIQVLTARP